MGNLAITYGALGRHEDALAMQESVLELRRRFLPPGHLDIALSLYNISESYERVGDMLRAMDCACENLRSKQAALPRGRPHLKAAYKKVHHFDNMEEYSIDHAAPVQHF